MTTVEKINEVFTPLFSDKENPNYVDLSNPETVKEVIRIFMVQMPRSILGPEANLVKIAGDILGDYHNDCIQDAFEFGMLEERTLANEQHKESNE